MCIFAVFVYAIGVVLHSKVILASKRDKEMTWKLDIVNSVMLIIHYAHVIIMYGITFLITDLYMYTGSWFCYASKAITMYGNVHVTGHSLIIALMKYVIIVQYVRVRKFGQNRVNRIFFWINFIYPAYILGIFSLVRPDLLFVYDSISQANRCLGKSDSNFNQSINTSAIKLHNICDISPPLGQSSFPYGVYIFRKVVCWLHVVLTYFNVWNILELFIYCLIFNFMRR